MIPGTVRLTPEQRDELAQAVGRLIVWLARVLHVPWWVSLLILAAVAVGLLAAAVWRPKRRPGTAPRPAPVDRTPVTDFAFCGHCGHNCPPSRRAVKDGKPLCFATPTDPRNCFQLVTSGGHRADGSCCTPGGR